MLLIFHKFLINDDKSSGSDSAHLDILTKHHPKVGTSAVDRRILGLPGGRRVREENAGLLFRKLPDLAGAQHHRATRMSEKKVMVASTCFLG